MATIFIDHKPYQVADGQNLLQACLTLGFDLPYFCWHPAMGSVGACRQCAVKQYRNDNDTQGRLVMACMTPAAEGTRLSINDPEARVFSAGVTEWLMVNHPHDCPVCDEGGECHLQDMVVMTGHVYRRYRGKKRTFHNQDLGPFVNHEMNRCIQCYRCVRFYRDYAGGRDFDVFALRNDVYFGRHEDGTLESEFSGNLVEVCPTGVFDDKTLKKHYTRKWDLQTAPSICVLCGLGCNTIPGERYGMLRRIRNRYNGEVNGYFLCDRGRYGYEFVNSDRRLRQPVTRKYPNADAQAAHKDHVLQQLASLFSGGARLIGVGSPRASLEANFALRTLVGPERFYLGMSETDSGLVSLILKILRAGPARSPSLHDVEQADAVFVLGEDVTEVAPMLALALRQSVRRKPMRAAEKLHIPEWDDGAVREALQDEKGPLFLAAVNSTRLDDVATETFHGAPDELARLGFAVAHALDAAAPEVMGLPDDVQALASRIAHVLREAERPLIVSGGSCGSEAVIQGAANVAWALCQTGRTAELCFTVPECNSLGLGLLGGASLSAAFQALLDGTAHAVIILENDLYRRAEAGSVTAALEAAEHVVVMDHLSNATTAKAEVVLPAGTFAEGGGTLVNNEGRAQRFYQVFVPDGDIEASWRWVRDILAAVGRPEGQAWQSLDDVTAALAKALPAFEPTLEMTPTAAFRVSGQKIPREPTRYSGRTAMTAQINVHEPKPPEDPDSPLAFSMEGYEGQPPAALIPRFWAPGWNSVQALNKFQSEVGGPLRGGDPGRRLVEPAQVAKPAYFTQVPAPFMPRSNEWLVVSLYHIFGSEVLSLLTPGVAQQAPRPYVALNPDDAALIQVQDGDVAELVVSERPHRLPVRIMPALPTGVAGIPVGLPELPWVMLPTYGRLTRASPE